VSSFISL